MRAQANEHERAFDLFGSRVRLLIGHPIERGLPAPEVVAIQLEGMLRWIDRALTRFDPDSELSRFNADSRRLRPASALLRRAVRAGLGAASATAGLVDPTLLDEIERAGYRESLAGVTPPSLREALRAAPPRRPAAPRSEQTWRRVTIDDQRGTIAVPPALRFDSGGTGKGLAADLAAERLAGYATFAVDAGGDLRIGGDAAAPRLVRVADPLGRGTLLSVALATGAVATSGVATRLWWTDRGFRHHLIDPGDGEPAWTGVVQATVVAATALEAETLAKAALLAGPDRAPDVLRARDAALVLDGGRMMTFGSFRRLLRTARPDRAVQAW